MPGWAFRQQAASIKFLVSLLTDSQTTSTEQDLKGYLTKEVIKALRDEGSMKAGRLGILHFLPTHQYSNSTTATM